MNGVIAFLRGNSVRNVRPAVYGWFFNLLFTFFIYFWYYRVFSIPAGHTFIVGEEGAHFSLFTFLADIFQYYRGSFSLVFSLALVFSLTFGLVSIYVSGGIYAVLVEDERTSFTNLIANSTQNFFSMLKVSLINLLTLIAALVVPGILLLVFSSIKGFTHNETALQVFFWLWLAVTALFLTFAVAIYDFSRIFKLRDDKGVWYSLKKGVVFTFTNKLGMLALFGLYGISLALVYLVYLVLMGLVENLLYLIIIFCFYQVFIIVRYYLKIVVMRAEMRLLTASGK